MALSKKPMTGMKDILPEEMEIRDYVIFEDAGGQVDGQNALRRHRGGGEGGELGIGEEAVEVGHGNHPNIRQL